MGVFGIAKKGFGAIMKGSKRSPTISSVKPGKNLKKKRDVQDSVVKDKDKAMAVLNEEGKRNIRTSVPLKDTNKRIADIVDKK